MGPNQMVCVVVSFVFLVAVVGRRRWSSSCRCRCWSFDDDAQFRDRNHTHTRASSRRVQIGFSALFSTFPFGELSALVGGLYCKTPGNDTQLTDLVPRLAHASTDLGHQMNALGEISGLSSL
jgi:hypothetical protein